MRAVSKAELIYWIEEREAIRVKKEIGMPKPWSKDPVFQTTYFTNVHREDDKVTKWIAEHWRKTVGKGHHNIIPALVIARMFNLPSHLALLPYWWNYERWHGWSVMAKSITKGIRSSGGKLFNGAYLITTCGKKMDKVDYVYEVAQEVANAEIWGDGQPETCDYTAHLLTCFNGIGTFLAGQIVADLKNTPGHALETAVDRESWCAPGPGSLRGLRRVEGHQRTSAATFLREATILYGTVASHISFYFDMQDFQNCLCEFDKYVRVKYGEGKSKRKYNGVNDNR